MPARKGHSAPGPRWEEPFKFGKAPGEGRYRYEDEPWIAWVRDREDGKWVWVVFNGTTMMAAGMEEKLYRAKYEAETRLQEMKRDE